MQDEITGGPIWAIYLYGGSLMPLKLGGGNLLQPYNPNNGEYTNKEKSLMLSSDWHALNILRLHHVIVNGIKPHFPTYGIHNIEYNKMFVFTERWKFNTPTVNPKKITNYLLDDKKSRGKSKILNEMGYWQHNYQYLLHDIYHYTDFETVKYNKINEYCFKVKAKTYIGKEYVTTIWRVDPKDYKLYFVSLIPRKDVYDND